MAPYGAVAVCYRDAGKQLLMRRMYSTIYITILLIILMCVKRRPWD